jgi:hypothetical protein
MVSGARILFNGNLPVQHQPPPNNLPRADADKIEQAMQALLNKKVIIPCNTTPIEFVSPIFITPKKDGDVRVILNLKKLNESVENFHFKMDNIYTALKLITKDCWMASLDLKDAYYSVPIHPESQNFLKFSYKGILFKFTAFPNGLSSCPRKFTKLLKPILATLRVDGHIIIVYIDDLLLIGHSYEKCISTIIDTLTLLEKLGFVIHPLKSIFVPVQNIVFLGFLINSRTMTICLTDEKKDKLVSLIKNVLTSDTIQIRSVAKVIGHMVSSFPAVEFGPLYYRKLDKDKHNALSIHKGNFEASMSISSEAKVELNWWLTNLPAAFKNILPTPIDIVLYSDASKIGWGAALGNQSTGGNWCKQESDCHINILEMKAALFALKSFVSELTGKHVKIMVDNSTTVFVLNNMGTSHNDMLHNLTVEIWEFCMSHKIYITAAHLPGSTNIIADKESRHLYREGEWMLNPAHVNTAISKFNFQPEIDLFASRLNKQFTKYCSYRPDPEATYIDAFSLPWNNLKFYCFPPFSCILQAVQKIQQEKATGLLVIPNWPTQPWFPLIAPLLVQAPHVCPPSHKLLQLPASPGESHPLMKNLELKICLVSGNNSPH